RARDVLSMRTTHRAQNPSSSSASLSEGPNGRYDAAAVPISRRMSMLSLAVVLALAVPLQESKPGALDTEKLGKELADKIQAKMLLADPITQTLKGWTVGNDPNPLGGIECWDDFPRGLRIALNVATADAPQESIQQQLDAKIPIQGLARFV